METLKNVIQALTVLKKNAQSKWGGVFLDKGSNLPLFDRIEKRPRGMRYETITLAGCQHVAV